MPSVFSRIVSGEIPAYKISENEHFLAFLDIQPQVPGHTLVIPKVETDSLWDLDASLLQGILLFAQPIAKALERAFDCERCGLSVIGLDVPHVHIHLLPINSARDMHLSPSASGTQPDLAAIQQRILAALDQHQ
ncbi:MAG: HIT family protein [Sphingobacteriales bacterium]|nr:MAG: HIT family protein [Sphingobacteriales bacterium]